MSGSEALCMVIKKEKIIDHFRPEEKLVLKKLEEKIDTAIRKDYVEGESITVSFEVGTTNRVRIEIEERYEEAGWIVCSDIHRITMR